MIIMSIVLNLFIIDGQNAHCGKIQTRSDHFLSSLSDRSHFLFVKIGKKYLCLSSKSKTNVVCIAVYLVLFQLFYVENSQAALKVISS